MSLPFLIFIIALIIITLLLMFSPKFKLFIRNNKEIVLGVIYLYITFWFTKLFITTKNYRIAFKMMTKETKYFVQALIFSFIVLYFLYKSITSFVDCYKKNKNKEEKKTNKKDHK